MFYSLCRLALYQVCLNHHHHQSPLCRLFTNSYLKQPCFRVCTVAAILYLQFMVYVMLFPMLNVLYFHICTFWSMCPVWLFALVPWLCTFPVFCSGNVWMTLRLFQLPLLLLVVTHYRLGSLGINSRWGEIFHTHPNWQWAHPASYTMGIG